ncbi:unnamed protein product [Symbiodinium sp. KB8]|nr:unnamed protein product [Symbiodinium sp. KB8]
MPIDKSRKRHFGYVFLEVSTPQDVIALLRLLPRLGEMLGTSRSNRQLHLHFARIQGWKNFMRQYSDLVPGLHLAQHLTVMSGFLKNQWRAGEAMFREPFSGASVRLRESCRTRVTFIRDEAFPSQPRFHMQVMFDSWWQRLARSRQAALADGDPLREFLLCLLDASYFELDGIGQLQLRVPAAVPPLPPVPDKELIEILSYKASSHSSAEPLTKDWIRDKLLVPRSVVSSSSSSQRRSGCAAYAPKPRSSSARGAQSSSRARPSSARPSSTRSAARSSSSGPVPRWSMSDASAEGSFFNDSSERPSSRQPPVPGGLRLRHPLQEREKANLPYRVPPPAKSAEQEAKGKAKAPVPHAARAPASHAAVAAHAPAAVAARASNAAYPSHQRRRPASAKIHKHKRVAEPEEDIIYEDVEGPHVDREIPAPCSSGDAQAPETERPVSVPHEAAASQAKRHHRAWRPASAKVHKHKRVERCENAEDIYDDLEPSLAESSDFSGQEDAASPDQPFEDAGELTPPSQGVDVWIHQESRGEAFHGHFEFVAPRRSSPPSLDRRRKTA